MSSRRSHIIRMFLDKVRPAGLNTSAMSVGIVFGLALFVRMYFPFENVFAEGWVRFQINDPWYHMRLIENLVQHFPHLSSIDPYSFYPFGETINSAPFFDLALGSIAWILGLGSPSKELVEAVGACLPAVLGALITIPVYLIGREVFNKNAGLLAAALVAIMPGQFLMRTLLGYTDHHVMEVLLSTLAALFVILAVRSGRSRSLTFSSIRKMDRAILQKPLVYSILSGLALGCYLISWTGGAVFIFIIVVYSVLQYVIDHFRRVQTDYLCVTSTVCFVVALIVVAPFLGQYSAAELQVASLVGGIVAFLVLGVLSSLLAGRSARPAVFPFAAAALAAAGLGLYYAADPDMLTSMFDKVSVLNPAGTKLTISEAQPTPLSSMWDLSQGGWYQFTTGFYLSVVSLFVVAYFTVKRGSPDKTFLLVWSAIMLMATLGQNRFAYYFAVNVALLTGYLAWQLMQRRSPLHLLWVGVLLAGLLDQERFVYYFALSAILASAFGVRELVRHGGLSAEPGSTNEAASPHTESQIRAHVRRTKADKKAKRRSGKAADVGGQRLGWGRFNTQRAHNLAAFVLVFFLAFYPHIYPENFGTIDNASAERGATDDWHAALAWMKDNTPEPFGDAAFFNELYEAPPGGRRYRPPDSAYGVMSWWDYGYWITYIAHRIPNASPSGQKGASKAAEFFTEEDVSAAGSLLDKSGSRYVIIDKLMATSKFYAMATYAGAGKSRFFDTYFTRDESGQLRPVTLFYPEYYRSMCSRLYNFGAREWNPDDDWMAIRPEDKIQVISHEVRTDRDGYEYKVVSDARGFSTYEEANAWIEQNPAYRIVGTSQLLSPVPLEESEHYKLVYSSPTVAGRRFGETIPEVQVFEYSP